MTISRPLRILNSGRICSSVGVYEVDKGPYYILQDKSGNYRTKRGVGSSYMYPEYY